MCALPARRIASSALCATFLVGIACPAAMAADSAPEYSHVASPGARHSGTDALLAQLRKLDGGELAPVADLLHALLKADNGQLTAAEARKLATAAKQALAQLAAEIRTDTATPTASAPATGVLLPAPAGPATDSTNDPLEVLENTLDAVGQAVDDLLESLDPADEASDGDSVALSPVDDLLTELDELIDALNGSDPSEPTLSEPTTLPSMWPLTSVPSLSPVTLPAITPALLGS
ncbi:hypothetical protein ABZ016_03415 [Streptomyces sp. NPDC006372]|uniref:hypothetical protein n=1 Tax=Streptomyces sp. NPDC006372 TaxID=3155599 RepID=UPI0033B4FCC9